MIGHISDTQTVFLSRILYISRGQKVALHPVDEQTWVDNGGHNQLKHHLKVIRERYLN